MALVPREKGDQLVPTSGPTNKMQLVQVPGIERTSNILSPTMLLTGHKAEVFSVKFSPSGQHIVSCSADKTILLWKVYGECDNYMMLKGHTNAVLQVSWTADERGIVSASADKSACLWDAEVGRRIRKGHHASFVNSCNGARRNSSLFVTGSDDSHIKVWDARIKGAVQFFNSKYPVTAVCFNLDHTQVVSGGIDNNLKVWDTRKGDLFLEIKGHNDTVTGLSLSPDGSYVLSNAMDNTVKIWDIRPFANQDRCLKTFLGATHNFEKSLLKCNWAADGTRVSAGSADRFMYIWDTTTKQILYKLPGHRGTIHETDFHPKEPIVVSCSSDQSILLGEIKPPQN